MADLTELLGQVMSNPQMMAQMASLAQSLGLQTGMPNTSQPAVPEKTLSCDPGGGNSGPPAQQDPGVLMGNLLKMAQNSGGDTKQLALIQALRPFLRPERIRKLERAVQVARMSRLAERALHTLSGQAGDFHV